MCGWMDGLIDGWMKWRDECMDVRIDGHEGQTALAKSASPTNNSVIGCKRLQTGWGLGGSKFFVPKAFRCSFCQPTLPDNSTTHLWLYCTHFSSTLLRCLFNRKLSASPSQYDLWWTCGWSTGITSLQPENGVTDHRWQISLGKTLLIASILNVLKLSPAFDLDQGWPGCRVNLTRQMGKWKSRRKWGFLSCLLNELGPVIYLLNELGPVIYISFKKLSNEPEWRSGVSAPPRQQSHKHQKYCEAVESLFWKALTSYWEVSSKFCLGGNLEDNLQCWVSSR